MKYDFTSIIDRHNMDAKIKENNIHVAVFCSPHNPCGRVWEKWEIEKAMEVYKANDCVVNRKSKLYSIRRYENVHSRTNRRTGFWL